MFIWIIAHVHLSHVVSKSNILDVNTCITTFIKYLNIVTVKMAH